MSEHGKKNLIQKLKDAEADLPEDLDTLFGKVKADEIRMDRILNEKLKNNLRYSAKPSMSEEQFKKNLLSRLEHSDNAGKPSDEKIRNSLIFLREKLLYSETASMHWSGIAAVFLFSVSIPFFLMENTKISLSYTEIPERNEMAMSGNLMEREGVTNLANGLVHSPPAEPSPASEAGVRERSFSIVLSKEDTLDLVDDAELADQSAEEAEKTLNEESILLDKLSNASSDKEKLTILQKLEKLYSSTGQNEKLQKTRKSIQNLD
ncbi:MAG: hypothetical protein OEZ34_15010 [Spirochaetia bacterium]|nr:hypothetical protein [Spirochaetia bacterium]